ncbi:MAG: hypothetical protein R3B45_16810 [Bdellovibrionota bacterium]
MFTFTWNGFRHGEMISMVGSSITKNPKLYFSRGIVICTIIGIVFAPIYYIILSWFDFNNLLSNLGVSAFIGSSHGFLLMYIFVEEPKFHIPSQTLRKFFIPIAVGYWIGHIAYGLAIGTILSSFLIYSWKGLSISGLCIIILCLLIIFFIKRGIHKQDITRDANRIFT